MENRIALRYLTAQAAKWFSTKWKKTKSRGFITLSRKTYAILPPLSVKTPMGKTLNIIQDVDQQPKKNGGGFTWRVRFIVETPRKHVTVYKDSGKASTEQEGTAAAEKATATAMSHLGKGVSLLTDEYVHAKLWLIQYGEKIVQQGRSLEMGVYDDIAEAAKELPDVSATRKIQDAVDKLRDLVRATETDPAQELVQKLELALNGYTRNPRIVGSPDFQKALKELKRLDAKAAKGIEDRVFALQMDTGW